MCFLSHLQCRKTTEIFSKFYPILRFFLYVYVASFFLIGGYLLCSVYNLLWIVSPRVGRLSSFLHGCHRETDLNETKMQKLDGERPMVKLNLYFRVSLNTPFGITQPWSNVFACFRRTPKTSSCW